MNQNVEITSFIPQRDPFVMVDALIYADEQSGKTVFQIRDENILVRDGHFSAPGMIENIAQTAAAKMGYFYGLEKKQVPVGYIGAIQNLEILSLPKINDKIETEISIKNQIFDVTIISGTIRCDNRILATCEMKIFIPKQS